MNSKQVTYADVVEFYKDKPENPKYTQEYISRSYGQKRGGYLAVAYTFNTGDALERDDFYFKEALLNTEYISKLQTFKNFSESEAKKLMCSVEAESQTPSQKWHLYVSYFAYQELAFLNRDEWKTSVKGVDDFTEANFEYYNRCSCPELMLWMIETSGICDQKVKEAFEKAEELCESGVNGKTICKEIRTEIVSWDNICVKINEEMQQTK